MRHRKSWTADEVYKHDMNVLSIRGFWAHWLPPAKHRVEKVKARTDKAGQCLYAEPCPYHRGINPYENA